MKGRSNRLLAIKSLIKHHRIESQESLLEFLAKEGFSVTQATLSRDLKLLKVGKISDGWSGYHYTLPDEEQFNETEKSFLEDVRRGVVSVEFSENIGVIKTRQGHADSVACALDKMVIPEILGTVAGDDTIFVVLREGFTKEDLIRSFKQKIPEVTA